MIVVMIVSYQGFCIENVNIVDRVVNIVPNTGFAFERCSDYSGSYLGGSNLVA